MTDNFKIIRFKIYPTEELDQLLENFLKAQKGDVSKFIKSILHQVRTGELVNAKTPSYHEKKLAAELRIKEATARIKESMATYYETFGYGEISNAAKNAISEKANAPTSSFIDEKNKRLVCPICQESFRWIYPRDLSDKKIQFMDHYYQIHNQVIPENMELELQKL